MRTLGKIVGWGMLSLAAVWLIAIPLIFLDKGADAGSPAMGGVILTVFFGLPGWLIVRAVRKAEKTEGQDRRILGFINSRDAFTVSDLARDLGIPEGEAAATVTAITIKYRIPLLFHASDRKYFHPSRVQRTFAVITHCQACGGQLGQELVFSGETRTCQYCGTAIEGRPMPAGGMPMGPPGPMAHPGGPPGPYVRPPGPPHPGAVPHPPAAPHPGYPPQPGYPQPRPGPPGPYGRR